MKKLIIAVISVALLVFGLNYAYFHLGWYLDLSTGDDISFFTKIDGEKIYINRGNGFEEFEIKGVDLGSGIPGEWSTDYAIDKSTYLRWFGLIKDMGANTVRVYTIQDDVFYNALYEYNVNNNDPLYLIQGVWVNDYVQNSRVDAFDKTFKDEFLNNCYTMINVIHGNCVLNLGEKASSGSGNYMKDVSSWVVGYILGVDWEDSTVVYTNEKYRNNDLYNSYKGDYLYTSEEAEPFEAFLAQIGDMTIKYESDRYQEQRIIAFSNWSTTDPFEYPKEVKDFFLKCAKVDVENIKSTDAFLAGQFASYNAYPYYQNYLSYMDDWSAIGLDINDFTDGSGVINTYYGYLTALVNHHSIPVVISDFGASTGRGIAQIDKNTGRNQGNMSEQEQGESLKDCYIDIKNAGCAGCCIFSWQDEWFRHSWNTMYAVNMKYSPYWSDFQTNDQFFGLITFDPGKEKSVCYVDGDASEWTKADLVIDENDMKLYMKYDEKFIYFYVQKDDYNFGSDYIYIPLDITPQSGSPSAEGLKPMFDRNADFIITIHGSDDSRVQVQEYYESLRANYSQEAYGFNTYYTDNVPKNNSSKFVNINMISQAAVFAIEKQDLSVAEIFETGILKYGNSNPENSDYDSMSDFIKTDSGVEIKIPWQLLNFSNPSNMEIHDDYYNGNYGVDYIEINKLYAGVGNQDTEGSIVLGEVALKGWGKHPSYHERLKASYYIVQEMWKED